MSYATHKADIIKDKEKIISFWNSHRDHPLDSKYQWLYENNIVGPAHVWLLYHENTGAIIGMASLFPRRVVLNNKTLIAAIAGDFFVDEKHRTLGPALMLQKAVIQAVNDGDFDLIYTYPNHLADPIFKRTKYQKLGNFNRWVKIIRTDSLLKSRGVSKNISIFISPLMDAFFMLCSKEFRFINKNKYTCKETDKIDDRFDHLWGRHKTAYDFIGYRDKDYLNWKYLRNRGAKHYFFIISDSITENLLGFFVLQQNNLRVKIIDALFPAEIQAQKHLLSKFLKYIRSSQIEAIEINLTNNSGYLQTLFQSFGFKNRGKTRNIFSYLSNSSHMNGVSLSNDSSWFMMKGDEDI